MYAHTARQQQSQGQKGRGKGQEARLTRLREQQMGFGTALPGSLPSLLRELRELEMREPPPSHPLRLPPPAPVVLCDIGAGCGNILSDVQDSGVLLPWLQSVPSSPPQDEDHQDQDKPKDTPAPLSCLPPPAPAPARLWGVEMNLAFARYVALSLVSQSVSFDTVIFFALILCSSLLCDNSICILVFVFTRTPVYTYPYPCPYVMRTTVTVPVTQPNPRPLARPDLLVQAGGAGATRGH